MNTSKPLPKYAAHGEPGTEAWIEVYAENTHIAQQRHRVYAHAPELLAALEEIAAENHDEDLSDREELLRCAAIARAAIAKATGK